MKELKSELSGNFKDAILGLCLSPIDFDASELRKAMKVISNTFCSTKAW